MSDEKREIAITDCDHANMLPEQKVFNAYHIQMKLFQCRTEEALIENLKGYVAVGNQYAPMTEKVFQNLPQLKCIVRYGVGVNNIDVHAAKRYGIAVCNVPDYGVQEVATQAVTMLLALYRKLILMNDSIRKSQWKYELSVPIHRMRNQVVGIIGIGRIGKCFAELMKGFGCRLIASDPLYYKTGRTYPDYIEMVPLEELLTCADFISIHMPLETSRNLIGNEEMKKMKPTACLINVSRGGIIDENALYRALTEGWIAGAACDVLETEPPSSDHPLFGCKNFICTPHMAWYSEEASVDLKTKLAEELVRFMDGKPLRNLL